MRYTIFLILTVCLIFLAPVNASAACTVTNPNCCFRHFIHSGPGHPRPCNK